MSPYTFAWCAVMYLRETGKGLREIGEEWGLVYDWGIDSLTSVWSLAQLMWLIKLEDAPVWRDSEMEEQP